MSSKDNFTPENTESHYEDVAMLGIKCDEINEEFEELTEVKNIVPSRRLKKLQKEDFLFPLCGKCFHIQWAQSHRHRSGPVNRTELEEAVKIKSNLPLAILAGGHINEHIL